MWADLGFTNLNLGRAVPARDGSQTGLGIFSILQFWEQPRQLVGLLLALTQLGELGEASQRLDPAEAFVRERDVRVFDPLLAYGRGRLQPTEGDPAPALAAAEERLQASASIGLKTWEVQLATAAAEAASALGDTEAMRSYTHRARGVIRAIASGIVEQDLRAALESKRSSPLGATIVGI